MPANSGLPGPDLLPLMRYRDVVRRGQLAVTTPSVRKAGRRHRLRRQSSFYAQLTYGNSMIMLGSARTAPRAVMRQPDEIGGAETQSVYSSSPTPTPIMPSQGRRRRDRARNQGRRLWPARLFLPRPEGHIWNFGTYNPWKGSRAPASIHPWAVPARSHRPRFAAMAGLLGLAAIACATVWWLNTTGRVDLASLMQGMPPAGISPGGTQDAALREELSAARAAKKSAEISAETARRELREQRAARAASESAAEALKRELAEARAAEETAVRAAAKAQAELVSERKERADLEHDLRAAREEVSQGKSQQGRPIETSATGPATEKAPDKAEWTTAAETKPSDEQAINSAPPKTEQRAMRKKLSKVSPAPRRPPPTYVTGLSNVPWPYSIWYKK